MQWLIDLLLFFFPVNCLICGKRLSSRWSVLCLGCENRMPRTGFLDTPDNPVSKIFWGRAPVEIGTSLLRFEKGSAYQKLLHELKYRGNQKTGMYLGRLLGHEIRKSSFKHCDLIVPVPIHKKRLRERGYNQSELIARGVSEAMKIPLQTDLLKRTKHARSQTSMGRYERYVNVQNSFHLSDNPPDLNGKRILLIDDVVTTGATLEACSLVLSCHYTCRIYVATVSCA